ncbi:retron system putative HNH endonuclease [Hymenobacter cellulosivorans]|uniref:TIGR02646 family protein n=1 Tax=Hymenobacter cellulosivorans TaxID=2932249 RepID=A0ABY4F2R9_9BACT|nr:retron system putative HNH endonuclease [Hymenobacter cellulosivorans]UOQ50965.1 TIGR02646 family protein [Hymenobacter cellulosivorans]
MIKVTKSQPAPAILARRGTRHVRQLEKLQEANPAACQAPDNTILHSRDGIYNDTTVKDQLRKDQHKKCCYCESLFTATSYGDVEHFRPKAGYQQEWEGPLHKPGYYWLAYEWSNLFFSCQLCNQEYKGNYFPLRNQAARAQSHAEVLSLEQPLLLDPTQDDPEKHLTFVRDAIKGLDDRGEESIRAFGLDRPDLIKSRIEHLKGLRQMYMLGRFTFNLPLSNPEQEFLDALKLSVAEGREAAEEARQIWQEAALDSAEYAGMVRANFDYLPRH